MTLVQYLCAELCITLLHLFLFLSIAVLLYLCATLSLSYLLSVLRYLCYFISVLHCLSVLLLLCVSPCCSVYVLKCLCYCVSVSYYLCSKVSLWYFFLCATVWLCWGFSLFTVSRRYSLSKVFSLLLYLCATVCVCVKSCVFWLRQKSVESLIRSAVVLLAQHGSAVRGFCVVGLSVLITQCHGRLSLFLSLRCIFVCVLFTDVQHKSLCVWTLHLT